MATCPSRKTYANSNEQGLFSAITGLFNKPDRVTDDEGLG